jgi:hypothetical protein
MKWFNTAALVFALLVLHGAVYGDEMPRSEEVAVLTHFAGGKPERIVRDAAEIAALAEEVLREADDSFLLLVTPDLIEKVKREGAIEVAYRNPKTVKVAFLGEEVSVSKLLLPIQGRFSTPHVTLFYADPEYGGFNVLVNKKGRPVIHRITELLH